MFTHALSVLGAYGVNGVRQCLRVLRRAAGLLHLKSCSPAAEVPATFGDVLNAGLAKAFDDFDGRNETCKACSSAQGHARLFLSD